MIWREKEGSRIKDVQMNNLRGLLGSSRKDRVRNARIRELCGVTKGVDERNDECVFRWLGDVAILCLPSILLNTFFP